MNGLLYNGIEAMKTNKAVSYFNISNKLGHSGSIYLYMHTHKQTHGC